MTAGVFRLRAALAAALLILFALPAAAQDPVCHLCGRTIRRGRKYYRVDSHCYCSRSCAERDRERKLPVCSVCGGRCRGRYHVSDGRIFCSRKCLETTFPICSVCGRRTPSGSRAEDGSFFACPECIKKPRCFACDSPTDGGALPDGRVICRRCGKSAVVDPGEAETIFRRVRKELGTEFGIRTAHRIVFSLIDRPALHRKAADNNDPPGELGLFVLKTEYRTTERRDRRGRVLDRKTEKISEGFSVYVLDHLPREQFEYVCAHELGHDWMAENYPGIEDPEIKEGFAENVGWLHCRMRGRDRIARQIADNPDPVYGGGFRRIKEIADREGFAGVRRFLESKNR